MKKWNHKYRAAYTNNRSRKKHISLECVRPENNLSLSKTMPATHQLSCTTQSGVITRRRQRQPAATRKILSKGKLSTYMGSRACESVEQPVNVSRGSLSCCDARQTCVEVIATQQQRHRPFRRRRRCCRCHLPILSRFSTGALVRMNTINTDSYLILCGIGFGGDAVAFMSPSVFRFVWLAVVMDGNACEIT